MRADDAITSTPKLMVAGLLLLALAISSRPLINPAPSPAPALALAPAALSEVEMTQLQVQANTGKDSQALDTLNAQARSGSAMTERVLGQVLLGFPNPASQAAGLRLVQQAAAQDDGPAQVQLGRLYIRGSRLVPRDYAQALHWFTLASRHKEPAAAYYLGLHYTHGYAVRANAKTAFHWFLQGAQQRQPAAMYMLANAYRDGNGVPQDFAKAVSYYEAAAEHEHPLAIQSLALAYQYGEMGLPIDGEKFNYYMAEGAHALKHPPSDP